jgi:hypothetical protein
VKNNAYAISDYFSKFINELSICSAQKQIAIDGRRKIVSADFFRIFITKVTQK